MDEDSDKSSSQAAIPSKDIALALGSESPRLRGGLVGRSSRLGELKVLVSSNTLCDLDRESISSISTSVLVAD